jgi:hypothetical protein
MTNYTRSNETFRHDQELKDAIYRKLVKQQAAYAQSAEYLEKVYNLSAIDRSTLLDLYHKAVWNRNFLRRVLDKYPEDDTYISNYAAFLKDYEVQELKENYAEDSTNQ